MATPPIANSVTAFVERQLESMSGRDRKLLVGLVSFLGLAFVSLLWYSLYNVLDDKASRVREAKSKLESVQMLQGEYLAAAAELSDAEERLAEFKGKRLSAHIEQVAQNRSVQEQLTAVNEIGSEVIGSLKQTTYKVDLKGIDYADAFGFLYEIETSGYPVHIQMAEFKRTSVKKVNMLNVTLELVVFQLAEG